MPDFKDYNHNLIQLSLLWLLLVTQTCVFRPADCECGQHQTINSRNPRPKNAVGFTVIFCVI